jgi:hypothetical protein
VQGEPADDGVVEALGAAGGLSVTSPEFRTWWAEYDVGTRCRADGVQSLVVWVAALGPIGLLTEGLPGALPATRAR